MLQNLSNMRKIIISASQAQKCLNEENNVNVSLNATGNNITAFANAVTQNKQDIMSAGKMGDPIIHISNPNSQNGSNDNAITQHVEVGKNDSIENAIEKQLNPTATSQGGDVEISGDGIYEMVYTKKQIDEARMKKMRSEGIVMTKQELIEMFRK